jgi:hypothetical protein
MVNISWKINGKSVSPQNLGRELGKTFQKAAIKQTTDDTIKRNVNSTRCPIHGKTPTLIRKSGTQRELSYDISGCCQTVIDSVKRSLK